MDFDYPQYQQPQQAQPTSWIEPWVQEWKKKMAQIIAAGKMRQAPPMTEGAQNRLDFMQQGMQAGQQARPQTGIMSILTGTNAKLNALKSLFGF